MKTAAAITIAALAGIAGFSAARLTAPASSPGHGATPEKDPAASAISIARTLGEMESGQMRISFAEVIQGTTSHQVIPFDPARPGHAAIRDAIRDATLAVITEASTAGSPAREFARINEVSAWVEDRYAAHLDATPGIACTPAPNAAGATQRSGYPDLRIQHEATGDVAYLDPKLFATGNRTSTLRTFYFSPRPNTIKVNESAVHLLVGLGHDGAGAKQRMFTDWHLSDLSGLTVGLKAEFNAANPDLYHPDLTIQSGTQPDRQP